jgi:hypothetical protein
MKITIFFSTLISLFFINFANANEIQNNLGQENLQPAPINQEPMPKMINQDRNPNQLRLIEERTQIINNPSPNDINLQNNFGGQDRYQEILQAIINSKFNLEMDSKLNAITKKIDDLKAKVEYKDTSKNSTEELMMLILAISGTCFLLLIIALVTLLKLSKLNKLLLAASK